MPDTNQTTSKAVERICRVLKSETLDPAKKEADGILNKARERADELIEVAEKQAAEILKTAQQRVTSQRKIFVDEIKHIAKETVFKLRDDILQLFSKDLMKHIADYANAPKYIAQAIEVVLEAIKKGGIEANIEAYISEHVPMDAVAKELSAHVIESLSGGKSLKVGSISSGCSLLMKENQLSIALTEEQLTQLLKDQVQDELENLLFG